MWAGTLSGRGSDCRVAMSPLRMALTFDCIPGVLSSRHFSWSCAFVRAHSGLLAPAAGHRIGQDLVGGNSGPGAKGERTSLSPRFLFQLSLSR